MAIIAKNMIVGGKKVEVATSTNPIPISWNTIIAKNMIVGGKKVESNHTLTSWNNVKDATPVDSPISPVIVEDNYLKVIDGDLERHYNKRSEYLSDMAAINFK